MAATLPSDTQARQRWVFLPAALLLFLTLAGQSATATEAVRLGWQTPWATQGQVVMALTHTNIPSVAGVEIDPIGFSYGAPLNSAALAGSVDVLFTADQPAAVLLSKTDQFVIVARLMYNRVCLYVPPRSPIRRISDLRDKTLMGPVGAAAERIALDFLRQASVPLDQLRLGSLDMAQQAALLQRADGGAWRGTDALYGFDPLPALFEQKRQARMLHCGNVLSVVLASRQMIQQRPQDLGAFLRAYALAWYFYARNPRLANAWFSTDSRLGVGNDVLDKCASVEPNRYARTIGDLRLTFTEPDYRTLEEALAFLRQRDIVREPLDLRTRVNLRPLRSVLSGDLATLYRRVRPLAPR